MGQEGLIPFEGPKEEFPSYFLEVACNPWLMVPSYVFKVSSVVKSLSCSLAIPASLLKGPLGLCWVHPDNLV